MCVCVCICLTVSSSICAVLLYSINLKALSSLISTMCELADSNTQLLLSYEERTTGNKPEIEQKFFKVNIAASQSISETCHIFCLQLVREQFSVEEIPTSNLDPVYSSEDIHVLILKKLISSM